MKREDNTKFPDTWVDHNRGRDRKDNEYVNHETTCTRICCDAVKRRNLPLKWVWEQAFLNHAKGYNGAKRAVLWALSSHWSAKNLECFASHKELERLSGCKRTTVSQTLNQAEKEGWIVGKNIGARRKSYSPKLPYSLGRPTRKIGYHDDDQEPWATRTEPYEQTREEFHREQRARLDRMAAARRNGTAPTERPDHDPDDFEDEPDEFEQEPPAKRRVVRRARS